MFSQSVDSIASQLPYSCDQRRKLLQAAKKKTKNTEEAEGERQEWTARLAAFEELSMDAAVWSV